MIWDEKEDSKDFILVAYILKEKEEDSDFKKKKKY